MDEKEYEYGYGYPSYAICENIDTLYLQIEALKLAAWDLLQTAQSDRIDNGQMTEAERKIDAHAEYDGEILKITVGGTPTRCGPPDLYPGVFRNSYWLENLTKAINRLNLPADVFRNRGSGPDAIATESLFERALCAIKVYWKRDVRWDVDNRVLFTIAHALRSTGVIPCQGWDKIAFLLVLGGVDRKNPRTEIRITKYPEDTTAKLFESI